VRDLFAWLTAPQRTNTAAPERLPSTVEFNRDIRPILSDKCFQSHGPAQQSVTVRFDLEDGAIRRFVGSPELL
jgi:hypothetical protein